MMHEQRAAVNAMLSRPERASTPTVEEMRAGFAAMMAAMRIAEGGRTTATMLAERPALLVEPEAPAKPGTVLYFHGGSNVVGSPQTALSLTAAPAAWPATWACRGRLRWWRSRRDST